MKLFFKPLKIEYKFSYVYSILIFVIATVICYYMDLRSLTIWSVNVWDTIYETKNPLNFYAYSAQNLFGLDHAMVGSDILIYLPWAIWNLPIWILQRFAGLEILNHPSMLLYSKCFLILFMILTCKIMKKIAFLLTDSIEDVARSIMLFTTSFFILAGVAYVGQNDILVIFVMLLAIYNYMKGNTKKFVLWSALSIALKPFFIFSYIALILLKEKKIFRIAFYGLMGMSIYILQKIPFLFAPMYKESLSYGPTSNLIGLLLESKFSIFSVGISILVLALLIAYAMAYLDNLGDKLKEKCIYYCVLPFICFFAFTHFDYYRPIYLFTVFYLLMLTKPEYKRINLLFEIVSTGCLLFYYMASEVLFFGGYYIHLPFGNKNSVSIANLLQTYLPNTGLSAFMAVYVFCMICIAIVNHPKFHSKNPVLLMTEERYLIILRSILFSLPLIVAIILKCI